jgi:MerR family mercuric resistance operon transcriptional regulator
MEEARKARSRHFPISEAARRSGVNVETIRYYERIGILAGPPRTAGGHRVYDHEDVRRFAFVRHAREAGFPLAEVRILLKARAGGASGVEVRDMASHRLEAVRMKIAELVRLSESLQRAISECAGSAGGRCPVIEMLECASSGAGAGYQASGSAMRRKGP